MDEGGRAALLEVLSRPRYEVFPVEGVEDEVAEHVPRSIKLAVTVSARKGIEATLRLAERLARLGFQVVPHLAARLVVDEAHLAEILERLEAAGVRDAFVVAGDVEQPVGPYADAFALLRAMWGLDHRLAEIGIAGYPESHPFISDEETIQAMFDKAPFASYVVSQVCFEPQVIADWMLAVRKRGVTLPIYAGIPGVVQKGRLFRIATKIGVGESARFLGKHAGWVGRLVLPGAYSPDRLVDGLAPYLAEPVARIAGFHIYTFNELERTEAWRRARLARAGRRMTRAP